MDSWASKEDTYQDVSPIRRRLELRKPPVEDDLAGFEHVGGHAPAPMT